MEEQRVQQRDFFLAWLLSVICLSWCDLIWGSRRQSNGLVKALFLGFQSGITTGINRCFAPAYRQTRASRSSVILSYLVLIMSPLQICNPIFLTYRSHIWRFACGIGRHRIKASKLAVDRWQAATNAGECLDTDRYLLPRFYTENLAIVAWAL